MTDAGLRNTLDEWVVAREVSSDIGETFETSWGLGKARVNHSFAEGVEYA